MKLSWRVRVETPFKAEEVQDRLVQRLGRAQAGLLPKGWNYIAGHVTHERVKLWVVTAYSRRLTVVFEGETRSLPMGSEIVGRVRYMYPVMLGIGGAFGAYMFIILVSIFAGTGKSSWLETLLYTSVFPLVGIAFALQALRHENRDRPRLLELLQEVTEGESSIS